MAIAAQATKSALLNLVDRDTQAYESVIEALRLPKATDAQKEVRRKALDDANRSATLVPLETARSCLEAMRQCLIAVRKGNKNSVTDGAVGALVARAGLEGALLNVRINLRGIGDREFSSSLEKESASLKKEADLLIAEVLACLEKTLGA